MKVRSLAVAFAFSLTLALASMFLVLSAFAPRAAATESTTPITVLGGSCGPSSSNCYGIGIMVGGKTGTAWIYPQGSVGGFILFSEGLEGAPAVMANVTSTTVNSRNIIGQVTQETISFTFQSDPNADGDTDEVQGSITVNLAYSYLCGHGCRWYMRITGGTGAQSITQD